MWVYTNTIVLAYDLSMIRPVSIATEHDTPMWVYTHTSVLAYDPSVIKSLFPSHCTMTYLCEGHHHCCSNVLPDCVNGITTVALYYDPTLMRMYSVSVY